MVRRRRPARLRSYRAGAQSRRAADGAQGARRPGGSFHALEFPHQPGSAQARRGADDGLLLSGQGARRNAVGTCGGGCGPGRCRPAPGGRWPGVRRPGADLGPFDRQSRDPQAHVHRFHADRQGAGRAGRPPHEAGDHGTGRPCAGDHRAGRRHRAGRALHQRRQVPQRRPDLHRADALSGAREHPAGFRRGLCRAGARAAGRQRSGRGHHHGPAGECAAHHGNAGAGAGCLWPRRGAGHRR